MSDPEELSSRDIAKIRNTELIEGENRKDQQVEAQKEIIENQQPPEPDHASVLELAQFTQLGEKLIESLGEKFKYLQDPSWAVGNLAEDRIRRISRKIRHCQRVESMKGPLNKESLDSYLQEHIGISVLMLQLSKSDEGFQQREHHTTRKDIAATSKIQEEPNKKQSLLQKIGL